MFHTNRRFGTYRKTYHQLRNAGLKGLGVSIDGPEDVHDVLRDRVGSFQAGMAAIKRAVDHGFTVTSNTQINQLTKDRLLETADLLEEAGVRIGEVNYSPYGTCS